jgi:PPP family 3-phenylpropionic acid transporter
VSSKSIEANLSASKQRAQMSAPRAVYFFFFAAASTLVPYLTLYYQTLGLSGIQIGILAAIPPIVSLFAAPAWGALADKTRRHRTILLSAMGLSAIVNLSMILMQQFSSLAFIVAMAAFVTAPIIPLVDNSVIEQLGARRNEYGKQRVWGSYGWGVAGLASGWLVGKMGLPVIFVSYALLLGLGLLMARNFPVSAKGIGLHLGNNVLSLLTQRRWILFLLVVWIAGAGIAMFNNYYFIFLDQIGTSDGMMGVALALGILSEIPFFIYSNRFLKRFGSAGVLLIGTGVITIRNLVCSMVGIPWQGLALQLIQGPTFALVWVAGVEFASQIAPPGMGATAQGIFGGVFTGLGFASGSLLGGILMQELGIRPMYQISALGVFLASLLFILVSRSKS